MTLEIPAIIWFIIIPLGVWELIWKGLALWRCGRNNQPRWFVAILLLNTIGILPMVYLRFYQKNNS